jgi:peptide/nickel transport system substrate-binding protein
MLPYLLEQCYVLQTAAHYTYRFWWPWLKNYSGEGTVGYYPSDGGWTQYVWIDQELKAEMGF